MQSAWTIGVPLELTGLGLCLIGMILIFSFLLCSAVSMDDRCATGTNRAGVVSYWNDINIFLSSLQCSQHGR